MYIVRYARMHSSFSLGLGLAVSNFQFWIVYHSVAQERYRGSQCLGLAVYICSVWMDILKYARRTSCFSVGLGLAVSLFQFWIVYHTDAQERDRGSRCG